MYSAHTGALPATLDELRFTSTNARGEAMGPLLAEIPRPPATDTTATDATYRYEQLGNRAFRITSPPVHGEVFTLGPEGSTTAKLAH